MVGQNIGLGSRLINNCQARPLIGLNDTTESSGLDLLKAGLPRLQLEENAVKQEITLALPDGFVLESFVPVAYYDKHMDCIRVMTHDRSVTEHRIDEFLTVHECNHRSQFDPEYVGFTIKGIRHIFSEVGLPLDGVYKLTDIIDKIVTRMPGTATADLLKTYKDYQDAGDLTIDFDDDAIAA